MLSVCAVVPTSLEERSRRVGCRGFDLHALPGADQGAHLPQKQGRILITLAATRCYKNLCS